MAGDWIKFECTTPDKPEVWMIAEELAIDPDAVVGKLLRIWAWFDQHTENGETSAASASMLDRRVGVDGFCEAVIRVGWMFRTEETLSLSSFDKHNGKTAKRRLNTAKRVAEHKRRKQGGNAEGNAELTARPIIPRPVRSAVLERDTRRCSYCGREEGHYAPPETATEAAMAIDHVIPLSRGGSNEISNLVASCVACNQFKGDRTPEECGLPWPETEDGKRYGTVSTGVSSALPKEEKRRDIGDSLRSSPLTIPAAPQSSAPVARFARSTNSPPKTAPSGYTQEFEAFWKTYPRGDGKAPAFKAWRRLSADDRQAAAADVPIRAASHGQWLKENGRFIPHAATYLNQRRWEDEIQPIAPGGDHEAPQRNPSGSRPRAVDRVIATQQAKLARLGIGGGNG